MEVVLLVLLLVSLIFNIYFYKKRDEGYNEAADIIDEAYTKLRQRQLKSKGRKVSKITKAGGYGRWTGKEK